MNYPKYFLIDCLGNIHEHIGALKINSSEEFSVVLLKALMSYYKRKITFGAMKIYDVISTSTILKIEVNGINEGDCGYYEEILITQIELYSLS